MSHGPDLSLFKANLLALAQVDAPLFARLKWPVDGSHTREEEDGRLFYKIHRNWFPLEDGEEEVPSLAHGQTVFLFGLGGGGQLARLLDRHPGVLVIAWERDPWLLLMTLQRVDVAAALMAGRLRLLLGADLCPNLAQLKDLPRLEHPLLAAVYRRERHLLDHPPSAMALIRDGALYVDDATQALRKRGFGVYTLDTEHLSEQEMLLTVRLCGARLLVSINYRHRLSEFCQQAGLKLVIWEIDPSLEFPEAPEGPVDHVALFSFRRQHVARFQQAGFPQASYLPLAANLDLRYPLSLTQEERAAYGAPVSYVGASLVSDARQFTAEFLRLHAQWSGDMDGGRRKLEAVMTLARADLSRDLFLPALKEAFADFLAAMARQMPYYDIPMLAAQALASEKRLLYVAALAPFGVRVWGDQGWAALASGGVRYAGRQAAHGEELSKIYCATAINVDIGRIYQLDIVTLRVFDVLACGGFLLAEHSEDLERLLVVGEEVESYRTLAELQEKVAYYAQHPQAAQAIAARGRQAVVARHGLADRFERLFFDL